MQFFILLAANILAAKDFWIIGDNELKEIFHAFPAMRHQASRYNKVSVPYIYKYYNVSAHYLMNNSLYNPLARIINSCIAAMNENNVKLPRFLVFMPDRDIL